MTDRQGADQEQRDPGMTYERQQDALQITIGDNPVFFLRIPEGFTPEDHGWIRADAQMPGSVPDNYTGDRGEELFGIWLRTRIPFKHPECLNIFLYVPDSGARGGWFGPQPDIPDEEVPLGALWGWLRDERDTPTELCT